jgi:hypothetical protein
MAWTSTKPTASLSMGRCFPCMPMWPHTETEQSKDFPGEWCGPVEMPDE